MVGSGSIDVEPGSFPPGSPVTSFGILNQLAKDARIEADIVANQSNWNLANAALS